jgi:riboflavin synthase
MFTGIITDIGRIGRIEPDGDPRFVVETGYDTTRISLGASIAHSGICLTVLETGAGWFKVQASAETLMLTTAASWRVGTRLNLEQAVRLGDELGGHIVSGHVDGVGRVLQRMPDNDSMRFKIQLPAALVRFVARKGSVTLDGVSLTVNEVDDEGFGVNIIPHTQANTTLGQAMVGDAVNIEIDMLARYVARLIETEGGTDGFRR